MATFSEESFPTSTSENKPEESLSETDLFQPDEITDSPSADSQEKSAQEELQIYQDKYIRLAAEFENYKRRAQRDQSDAIRYANESLLKNLLSTLDNLERAIQCGKDAGASGSLLEGVELTHKQFLETIEKLGLRQVSSAGSLFDPNMHQAVAQVESETVAPNTVVEEFQKGYFLYDRILRPAMVTVAKEKSDKTETTSTQDTGEEGGIQA
ncbi:MAG: nucleotide exchange factor GrpE [Nitrospirota bacterium]|nr:nucleotide exchange factor GrpE [Nitrospirota bacterium]MDX2419951.1 nucleotide exchange factor GrpE [Nitrospirota bacterium]